PLGATVEDTLDRAAGIPPSRILRMVPGSTYYPSPGGILEEVRSVFVEIKPTFVNAPLERLSRFSPSGRGDAAAGAPTVRCRAGGGIARCAPGAQRARPFAGPRSFAGALDWRHARGVRSVLGTCGRAVLTAGGTGSKGVRASTVIGEQRLPGDQGDGVR